MYRAQFLPQLSCRSSVVGCLWHHPQGHSQCSEINREECWSSDSETSQWWSSTNCYSLHTNLLYLSVESLLSAFQMAVSWSSSSHHRHSCRLFWCVSIYCERSGHLLDDWDLWLAVVGIWRGLLPLSGKSSHQRLGLRIYHCRYLARTRPVTTLSREASFWTSARLSFLTISSLILWLSSSVLN